MALPRMRTTIADMDPPANCASYMDSALVLVKKFLDVVLLGGVAGGDPAYSLDQQLKEAWGQYFTVRCKRLAEH